jgi:hypothetical protein
MSPVPTAARRVAAAESASVLEKRLGRFRGDLTVADAAARGGLALRDAESALYALSSEYHGHLKATETGDLIFSFPRGLTKPQGQGWLARAGNAVGRALLGAGRFVIRAWVSVVLVGYAVVLGAVLIALAAKDDGGDGIGDALGFVLRIVAEALFWTFHPFSPVMLNREPHWARMPVRGRREKKLPFYEKVNKFVFGPPAPRVDLKAQERMLIAEIRRLEGRVGAGDIMRLLGGTREEAESVLCRLVIDYDGEVEVSDDGAVMYKFAALRKTVEADRGMQSPAIWHQREVPVPLTGNSGGTNFLLGAINAFNLVGSGVVLANGLTFERIGQLLAARAGDVMLPPPAGDVPIVLGMVPFVFSAALFALPALRAFRQGARNRAVARENGRRGLLKALLDRPTAEVVNASELRSQWLAAGGQAINDRDLTTEVRRLGGEPDVTEGGTLVFKFEDLSRESRSLTATRRTASPTERAPGQVVFSSDDN